MSEQWRPVPGFPDYEVSDQGRVRSHKSGSPRVMSLQPARHGYLRVRLCGPNGARGFSVHRLVLDAFVGPLPSGPDRMVSRHLDGDPANNRLDNLAYGTQGENIRDAVVHGTHAMSSKDSCAHGHQFTPENIYTLPSRPGVRYCRECRARYSREFKARRRAERSAA